MKKCLKSALFVLLFMLIMRVAPVCAEAATFQSVPLSFPGASDEGQKDLEKLKIGSKYFWIRDYKLFYSASPKAKGQKIANDIYGAVTDGKVIYFARRSSTTPKATVYSYTVKNKKKKSFGNVKDASSVIGCVGGKVYLTGVDALSKVKVIKFDPKSKKASEKFVSYRLDSGISYGRYVTGWEMVFNGDNSYTRDLYLHDLITGKGKCIAKNGAGYNTCFTKNKLYYKQDYYKKDPSTKQLKYKGTKIYTYNLKTGKKTAVTKMLKIYTITKLTSSYVKYMQQGTGKVKTVKF